MNKKTVISATNNTIRKLNVLSKKKKGVGRKLVVTAEKLGSRAKRLAVAAKGDDLYKNKKTVISAVDNTILKLKVLAKKKEGVRGRLVVVAKKKEDIRSKLATTARQLAAIAKEKESIRGRLVVTAKEKESVRSKLAMTAKNLAKFAKEKESIRRKLAITAKKLAAIAKEKESIRVRLVVTAKEKESVRSKLATTARQLAAIAKEKENVRRKLAITAKKLAAIAKEKESIRGRLAVTAKKLAATAKEIESANKELRSLDLAKDEFVSIASHQLRTPLTALKGFTGMLLDGDAGPINDKQHEYLIEMKNANDRMIKLITALLNVSRVDLGVFTVDPEPVNFEKVAESVLKEMEMKIAEKKLQVVTNFEKGLPLINVDPKITRMIFQNLLSNAVKYTPQGGSVSLDIKKTDSTMLISVADTGYGIPEAVQTKIFTKMFRADNARTRDPEGTGLGLYIIKATIEQTGGKIWFKSKENKGSTFYVSIPLEGMKKKQGSKRLE